MVVNVTAGQLRHRIAIHRATTARNNFGVDVETFSALATIWAKIEGMGGDETQQADKTEASSKVMFTMRYYSGLTTLDQFVWDSRTFRITHIDDVDGMNVKHVVETVEID